MSGHAKSLIMIGILILMDLFALPWALFFLLAVQLHGLVQAPAIWLHSLSLFGGVLLIPRVCFTWFSLQIVVLVLAGLAYYLYDPGGVRTTLRQWLGTDPETLTDIIKRSIDQAIPTVIRDLPTKQEIDGIHQALGNLPGKQDVYQILFHAIYDYQAEQKEVNEAEQPAEGGEEAMQVME